jgi:hypothetical protein
MQKENLLFYKIVLIEITTRIVFIVLITVIGQLFIAWLKLILKVPA